MSNSFQQIVSNTRKETITSDALQVLQNLHEVEADHKDTGTTAIDGKSGNRVAENSSDDTVIKTMKNTNEDETEISSEDDEAKAIIDDVEKPSASDLTEKASIDDIGINDKEKAMIDDVEKEIIDAEGKASTSDPTEKASINEVGKANSDATDKASNKDAMGTASSDGTDSTDLFEKDIVPVSSKLMTAFRNFAVALSDCANAIPRKPQEIGNRDLRRHLIELADAIRQMSSTMLTVEGSLQIATAAILKADLDWTNRDNTPGESMNQIAEAVCLVPCLANSIVNTLKIVSNEIKDAANIILEAAEDDGHPELSENE